MPFDETTVANMALGHCGIGNSITTLESDTSAEGRACQRYIETSQGVILEMKPWKFATERWTLTAMTFESGDHFYNHWSYRYRFPVDCARPDLIINPAYRTPRNESDKIPFKVAKNIDGDGGRVILCSLEDAILEGNIKNPDYAEYEYTFALGQSLLLGVMISPQLRVDKDLKKNLISEWRAWQREAMDQNNEAGQDDPYPISQFQSVRG